MVERGGTRDANVGAHVRKGCSRWGNRSLLCRTNRMICSSLELEQTQPPNMCPTCMITMVLSNNRMSEMKKNSSFPRLDLLKRPIWSVLSLEAMLVSRIHCPRLYSSLRLMWMPIICATTGGHVDVLGLCYC